MAHRRQERTFGAVGLISQLFGGAQFVHQLTAVTDVDPATDDALHLTQRIPVGKNPVVNGHDLIADVQLAIHDQWRAFAYNAQIVSLKVPGFVFITDGTASLYDRFADDFFALGAKGFQVTVITGLQNALAVSHINGVGCFIDHGAHKFELIAEGALSLFSLLYLAAHVSVPDQ